jgi:hypothetical protein
VKVRTRAEKEERRMLTEEVFLWEIGKMGALVFG